MSPKPLPPAVPSADVQHLLHDLRNSIYAIGMGVEVLAEIRQDAERFEAIVAMMAAEQQRAASRLDEFAHSQLYLG